MNDQDLDRRLSAADPALPTPTALESTIDVLVARPITRRRRGTSRRWRPVLITGGVLVFAGGLVAATDIDTILLANPPFSTLEEGTARVFEGLAYSPLEGPERGEQCTLYIDLAGLTDAQFAAASESWPSTDPATFADAVHDRLDDYPDLALRESPNTVELEAIKDQILAQLHVVAPGIEWGSAPPQQPFAAGEPHLVTISQVCDDDLTGLGYTE